MIFLIILMLNAKYTFYKSIINNTINLNIDAGYNIKEVNNSFDGIWKIMSCCLKWSMGILIMK